MGVELNVVLSVVANIITSICGMIVIIEWLKKK